VVREKKKMRAALCNGKRREGKKRRGDSKVGSGRNKERGQDRELGP